jgi:hypothetical protein
MRWIVLLLTLAACNQDGPSCPCTTAGYSCVYLQTNAPVCLPQCTADGGCGSGQQCVCGSSCLQCADCIRVCN